MALKSFFFQKITKNRPAAGSFVPTPPKPPAAGSSTLRPQSVTRLSYITLLDASRALPLHVICGLPPPQSKILATPLFLSFAVRGPVLEKSVLGLGFKRWILYSTSAKH